VYRIFRKKRAKKSPLSRGRIIIHRKGGLVKYFFEKIWSQIPPMRIFWGVLSKISHEEAVLAANERI
jgi:hypothetical protein